MSTVRRSITANEIRGLIVDNGWDIAWFATEDNILMVDLCCHYRLEDGKVLFVECTDHTLDFIKWLAAKMIDLWTEISEKCQSNCEP